MTDQQDPIIAPPLELMRQMREQAPRYRDGGVGREEWLIERASGWGYEQRGEVNEAKLQQARDQELEACNGWLVLYGYGDVVDRLRAARRPKPPSLKEQALEALNEADQGLNESEWRPRSNTIRRALEALPDD
jgi:hypothetical protein